MRGRTGVLLAVVGVLMLGFVSASVDGSEPSPRPRESSAPSPASGTSGSAADRELVEELASWATEWLETLPPATSAPLDCPAELLRWYATPTNGDARGCVWGDFAGQTHIRVQNLSAVPMTVHVGKDYATVVPGVARDFPLGTPKAGQKVEYSLDLRPAAAAAVLDYVKQRQSPAFAWITCTAELTTECLTAALARLLPPQVEIRGTTSPAGRIAALAPAVWTAPELIAVHEELVTGEPSGTLTVLTR
jgi:hypothetical protein